MAKRIRDHKAEYRARKARATELGYKSVREARRSRKETTTSRIQRTIPASEYRLRKEAKEWSDKHSRVKNSRYRADTTLDQLNRYLDAFVRPDGFNYSDRVMDFRKRQRIRRYYVPFLMDESEWDGNPSTVPLRR